MTLVLLKRTAAESATGFEPCANGCRSHSGGAGGKAAGDTGYRVAAWTALILGQPAAGLCEPCARAWSHAWESAGGTIERKQRRGHAGRGMAYARAPTHDEDWWDDDEAGAA